MRLIPDPKWLEIVLASFLLLDVAISIRPPALIRDCLNGVHFPEEWWWTLIVIKSIAVAGLLIGLGVRGVGPTATAGVIAYFLSASYAHIRARFLGRSSGSTASGCSAPRSPCSSSPTWSEGDGLQQQGPELPPVATKGAGGMTRRREAASGPGQRPRMVGINHVALEVGDLEAAVAFYRDLFEIQSIEREEGMAFLAMGDQFLALREAPDVAPQRGRHFGLVVDDKEGVRAGLLEAGIAISQCRRRTSTTRGATTCRSSTTATCSSRRPRASCARWDSQARRAGSARRAEVKRAALNWLHRWIAAPARISTQDP